MKKKIGILGGLSPESTVYYYQYLFREYNNRYNDYHFPKIIIYSVTFQEYVDWGMSGDWKAVEDDMVEAITALKNAGADFVIIATNTLHYVYDAVAARVEIPILSLVDAVCKHAQELGVHKLALLGTKLTMKKPFYHEALAKVGIETLVPDPEGMDFVQDNIFSELSKGIIKPESKTKYLEIINILADQGAEGVILGCTEIPLIVKQDDLKIHVLDTSLIHAEAALNYALE
jgi:aspartate racemase